MLIFMELDVCAASDLHFAAELFVLSLQCTHQLLKLIKKHSKTNMHKFELYALKNIFATSVQGSHLASPQYQHCADAPSAELETLRARLADLSARNSFLREEAAASESLLGQMNKTIFDLRVGAQVLDTHDVKPLADAVSGAAQWHADLVQLSSRARRECSFFLFPPPLVMSNALTTTLDFTMTSLRH